MKKEIEEQLTAIAMRLDSVEQQLHLLSEQEDYDKSQIDTYLYAVIDSIKQSSKELYQCVEQMYHKD